MNVTLQYILKCDPATLTKRSAARARRDDPVLVDAEWVARRVQPRCFAAGRRHAGLEHLPGQVDDDCERRPGGQMAPHMAGTPGDVEHHVVRRYRNVRGDPPEHLAVAEERVRALELGYLARELAARDVAVLHGGEPSGPPLGGLPRGRGVARAS